LNLKEAQEYCKLVLLFYTWSNLWRHQQLCLS